MARDGYPASVPVRPGADHRPRHFVGGSVGSFRVGRRDCAGLRVLVASHVSGSDKVEAVERYGENVVVTETRVRIGG